MDIVGVVCAILLIVAVGGIIGVKLYKHCKDGGEFDFDYFVDEYGDAVISTLKSVISIIRISGYEFESKEQYEKMVVAMTIEEIKNKCEELGLDTSIFDYIDLESLTSLIYDILHKNKISIFSVLNVAYIDENKKLFDEEIAESVAITTDEEQTI